jgi:hypothetical protein
MTGHINEVTELWDGMHISVHQISLALIILLQEIDLLHDLNLG